MRVVVVGAGDVGSNTARRLADAHDVTVVDIDHERVAALGDELSVDTVAGDGRSLDVLHEAGVADADVVVASTDDDAANVMICGAVENATDAFTLARVQRADLFETWREAEGAFGVDLMLSVDRLTAQKISRAATLPGARAAETFADGLVEMAEFDVEPDGPITGERVVDADRFPSLTFAALFREDDVIVPSGETTIEAGDRVVAIGSPTSLRRFGGALAPDTGFDPGDDVVILGGGEVGALTAAAFAAQGLTPRIVEHDETRVADLEARLPNAAVASGDATDLDVLTRERVGDADLVVATMGDETNYLAILLARHLGAVRTAAVVTYREHAPLFDAAGVDFTVDPRSIVAEELAEVVDDVPAEGVALLEGDSAEVLELTVDADSALAGESIENVARSLSGEFVIGAIVRGGTLHAPRGGTIVQAGDHVIVFVAADVADSIAAAL